MAIGLTDLELTCEKYYTHLIYYHYRLFFRIVESMQLIMYSMIIIIFHVQFKSTIILILTLIVVTV